MASEEREFEEEEIPEGTIAPEDLKIAELQKRLEACEQEKQEYLAGWQRAKADFINAREREDGERQTVMRRSKEKFLEELLPVLDSFGHAFANRDAWEKVDASWRQGIEYIHSQFLRALESQGIQTEDPIGRPFDPARHESIETVATDDPAMDHAVAEVLQPGYLLDEKVIRPAKVRVAMYKSEQ